MNFFGMSYIVFFLCFSEEYLQTGLFTDRDNSEMEKATYSLAQTTS